MSVHRDCSHFFQRDPHDFGLKGNRLVHIQTDQRQMTHTAGKRRRFFNTVIVKPACS
jgi:hypothetical protein